MDIRKPAALIDDHCKIACKYPGFEIDLFVDQVLEVRKISHLPTFIA